MIPNWCCSFVMCSYETVFWLPSFCLVLRRWGWPVNDWNVFLLPHVYLWDCVLQHIQGRSSSTSSFHASLLQAIAGVMSFAVCSQVVSQVSNTSHSCRITCKCSESVRERRIAQSTSSHLPRSKPLVIVGLPASLSARSFPFTPACPGQYTHRSFRRWMHVDHWHIPVWASHSAFHFL